MNNEVFLQRISAAVDVRDQQLAEQATEASMQVIVEACEASMPRRPANNYRKPAYWWNEELAGLRRDCNKRRRIHQRARRRNQPNVSEMEEAYKQARRTIRIAIQLSKNGCCEKLIGSINQDPWGPAL